MKDKKCSKCQREFPATKEFFFCDKTTKSGLKSQCKECESDKKFFGLPKGQFDIDWKSFDSKSGIYKISNTANGKMYIGSAVNLCARLSTHLHTLTNNKHENEYMQNSFNKYGKDKFKFEIVEIVYDTNDLLNREQFWLDHTKSYNRSIGYNILKVAGNCLGNVLKEETKEKLRRVNNKPIIQLTVNGEYVQEWLGARDVHRHLGYVPNNINLCANGKSKQAYGFLWIFKEKYESPSFNVFEHMNKRTVLQYNNNGEFIREWECTVAQIANELNIKDSNISQCCYGKQKTVNGYIWRFRYNNELFDHNILISQVGEVS